MPTPAQFTTITTEGGLLPSDLISRLVNDTRSLPGTRDEDYRLTPGRQLREIINRSWNDLLGAWQVFQPQVARLTADDYTAALTRDRWLLPLFAELGYGRLERIPEAITIGDKDYSVSHRHAQAFVHLVGWNVRLDRRTAGVVGAARAAPHSMVQELLNRTDDHLWAVVSNGRQLRILRDNSSLTRAAYVEFDLEQMFSEGIFTDFVALWLLVHASRIEGDPQIECWLETWANEARQQGVRALDTLGQGFEDAIATLGQGFLAHPANNTLRARLRDGDLAKQDYYRQLLRLVYRLVFLLVAEDRSLLHPPDASAEAKERYSRYYSLSRIRDLARRRRGTKHGDLWDQLVIVARSLGPEGQPLLGLPALNSGLWAADGTAELDSARLSNTYLLAAMRSLAYTRQEEALHRVDYRNLGSEELGSVYESLLELQPFFDSAIGTFRLEHASGNERKTTGSYYTPTALISSLLDTSLDRLLDEAVAQPDPEQALLDLKVIDPACGSGHFLVAAAQRIARRLAVLRTDETDPPPSVVRHALREVIGRCVYGIDRNPMAVELCKVSLWLESVEPGKPLSFLDHHIVCGNALLGATPRLLEQGVPDAAFISIEGDDKPTVIARRKANAREREHRNHGVLALAYGSGALARPIAAEMASIEALPSDTSAQVAEQADRYRRLQDSVEAEQARFAADAWCAAFMALKTPAHPAITDATVRMLAESPEGVAEDVLAEIADLTKQYRFLHWHLAFPQIYHVEIDGESETGTFGGFDLILGNPPWDTLSPDRKEFFAADNPHIRFANKVEQDAIVHRLLAHEEVAQRWSRYRRELYSSVHFMKSSGRYRLFAPGNLGKGDFNVYRIFVEAAMQSAQRKGLVAQVVPSGFYNGANASAIRRELFDHWQLSFVFGFINTTGEWFPEVHRDTSFGIYTARKGAVTEELKVAFELRTGAELAKALAGATTKLSTTAIREQSPEALAIPEIADASDAALVSQISSRWPKLGDESFGPPIRHYQAELHMGNDRDLFGDGEKGLAVYEGRMIDQFDHRAKAYCSGRGRSAVWQEVPFGDPRKAIAPQWRLPEANIPNKVGGRVWRYRIGWCDVTGARNERSLIAALIPPGVICGHSVPTFIFPEDYKWAYMPWLAVINSFCADYLIRHKVALHVTMTVLDSLPIPRLPVDNPIITRLSSLALRLSCTGLEMTDYWNSMTEYGLCDPAPAGIVPAAALIDPEERAWARAEIDAIVAKRVYGISSDELSHVLDQFPVLERREKKADGSYTTKDRVLAMFSDV